MKYVVDTNVPIVANGNSAQATPNCVRVCARWLGDIKDNHILILDDGWHIIREYMKKLQVVNQPLGNAFLKWVLTNWSNPEHCELQHITPLSLDPLGRAFAEFPSDADLARLDSSDHKFVAVALAHPERPPILNAVDTDWLQFREPLIRNGVQVEELCPDSLRQRI